MFTAVDDDDSETLSEVPVTTDGPAKIKLNTSYIEVTGGVRRTMISESSDRLTGGSIS